MSSGRTHERLAKQPSCSAHRPIPTLQQTVICTQATVVPLPKGGATALGKSCRNPAPHILSAYSSGSFCSL